ncbi:hypothetical protein PRIPAC_85948 [Pristionchus pacificus]|uniref:Serpentine receptor class gamma n=1 Tax=Pristionchus pacificus TaxID=54126 RepID=A0A2A6BUH0_PRIPA|nr:hypothetical protein PRIPAC_85948 [Pristionchus pacificus]|eukprot:PDM69622.1 G protein-coupled receptor [Pristionchus pacificus]
MGTNSIYLLYGVPGVVVYVLTVASICTTRARLNATFVTIFLLTAVTNLITYLNTWMALRLQTETWFFGYYEFINRMVIISYVHQFFVGLLYYSQNVNAFLITLDRYFAIAGFLWKDIWNRHYKTFALAMHVVCIPIYYCTGGFLYQNRENSFVYNPVTNTYSLQIKGTSSTATSLSTQVAFGSVLLLFCLILNIISFHRLRLTQISGKNVKIVERSMFAISICIFFTQALNILILIAIFYVRLISPNTEAYMFLVTIMPFLSDTFSLGPGVYTIIVPGPIRRQCISILLPCRKTQAKDSSTIQVISVHTAHTL